jgi:hypothetical protein
VLTEEKLDDTGARLEIAPRKSLKHIAQETGASKSSTRMAIQLLKPPLKVGVWCAVSARRFVIPIFLMKQLIAKNICVQREQHFQHLL